MININEKTVAKNKLIDKIVEKVFMLTAILTSISIIFIIIFIFLKGVQPFLPNYEFGRQSITNFLFGRVYNASGEVYGIGFIIINTLLISFGAVLVSAPISVVTALFVVKVAPKNIRGFIKSVIELLAAIPSVIYGVFAYGVITNGVYNFANSIGIQSVQGLSSLSAILLLAIMIYPTITMLSITSISSVDRSVEEASLALGATKMQTNYRVVLKSASSGIFAGIILGVGRAFGEATAVSMVIGNSLIGPSLNLFEPSRTLTSTILIGLKETSGLDYDIRFSIGFVLLFIILASNLILNSINRRIAK